MLDLKKLLETEHDRLESLVEEHLNPTFVQVLRLLGYDRQYVSGRGAYLYDDAGNQYLDCLSGWGAFACGRNHPAIRDVVQQALHLDLPNLPKMGLPRLSGLLARELVALAPPGLEMVFFTSSGSEGVETALKYARAATGKARIVHCDRSFHGLTLGALSVNGHPEFQEGFGPMLQPVTTIPYNDFDALEGEVSKGDVAGFIVEPIQGEGVFLPDDDFLPRALELCRCRGVVFIADEVQTGFGRTGRMFACEHWNIAPDILITAKALSGGYVPVGAVLSQRWIHDRVFSRLDRCVVHSSTFSENDLAMAAGLATLHVLREERLVENAAAMGGLLQAGLREVGQKYEMFREVRGQGLLIGIELAPPSSLILKMGWNLLHKLDTSLFCQVLLIPLLSEHRILAQVAGHRLDVIKLLPSLVINREDVNHLIHAFDEVMASAHRWPGPAWEIGKHLASTAFKAHI